MRSIAHISDLHFGRHDVAIEEDLVASLNRAAPDLVAISGDITQRARRSEFAAARRFLDRLSPPTLAVPGNHDVPLYNVLARWRAPLANYQRFIVPACLPDDFFRDREIAVLGLNTARRLVRKEGRVSVAQVAHLLARFRAVPPTVLKAVVTHHPLGLPHGATRVTLAGRSRLAMEAIRHAGVRLLLSGHHHRAVSGAVADVGGGGAVLVLHAGTAISSRTRGAGGNSWNLVTIDDGRVVVQVMDWLRGRGFGPTSSLTYRLGDGRWYAEDTPSLSIR